MSAKMTRFSNWEFVVKSLLASAIGFVFYGHLCTMHFVQEQEQQQENI